MCPAAMFPPCATTVRDFTVPVYARSLHGLLDSAFLAAMLLVALTAPLGLGRAVARLAGADANDLFTLSPLRPFTAYP